MKLELHFGALVPNLGQQLFDAGVIVSGTDIKHWQKDADAIVRLNLRGLLTDSAMHSARQKLMKKIVKGAKRKGRRHG
jgi:hypothetical protein